MVNHAAMVAKGQFLERMTAVHSDGLMLEGLFHEGRPGAGPPCLVASPHPAFGGSMDSPVCAELAWAVTRRGLASLRFNYRGVGGSQGHNHRFRPDAREELADLRAAARLLAATADTGPVHVAGYSFGAWLASWMALEAPRQVGRLVLVAPPLREMPFDLDALSRAGVETLVVVGTLDRYFDFDAADQIAALPNFTLQRLEDADHFFQRHLATAGRLAADHLAGEPAGRLVELESGGEPLELDEKS